MRISTPGAAIFPCPCLGLWEFDLCTDDGPTWPCTSSSSSSTLGPLRPNGRLLFILLIDSTLYLRFLKTPASAAHTTSARVHCTGPLPGQVGPGLTVEQGSCAIVRTVRTRTSARARWRLKELTHAGAKSANRSKIKQIRKTERKAFWTCFGLGPCRSTCTTFK